MALPARSTPSPACTTKVGACRRITRRPSTGFASRGIRATLMHRTTLGAMFENGQGVPRDCKAAASWYRKAADQGLARAQHNLGDLYARGDGVPQSDIDAAAWYGQAANQGFALAQYAVGCLYARGTCVPKNAATAVKWYRKAADQGDAAAQFSLGVAYESGDGVQQDFVEAMRWYRQAAEEESRSGCVSDDAGADRRGSHIGQRQASPEALKGSGVSQLADAFLRVGHELSSRHLALRHVVNGAGTPKSLHSPIAALDSCRSVYRTHSMQIPTCVAQRHVLIDFPQQRVFHDSHSSKFP